MAFTGDLDPDLWFDQEGAASDLVTEGVAGTGHIKLYSGDSTTSGIPGLDLTAAGAETDKANAARILKAVLQRAYTYYQSLSGDNIPDTMTVTRSSSASGTTMYLTYSVRFAIDTDTAEVSDEA
jgi:hypothetical protein